MPRDGKTTVGLISLGCAKNLIDSEIMIGHLAAAGMVPVIDQPEQADVLIINTCSFIDQAKQESIDTILGAVDDRSESRPRQKIVVAGCLSQRFAQELPKLMPEVDAFIGLDQITKVAPVIERLITKNGDGSAENLVTARPQYIPDYDTPRFQLTLKHTAYLKIAEGCNHPCSFCIIPKIRGQHRSRSQESVVREARSLVASGVKELNLISQDTTYFGMDHWAESRPNPRSPVDSTKGESLASLLRELNEIEGDFWIRLLYTHPAHWSDELIETIAQCPKVARYVDMPLQHISDRLLMAMKRETDGSHIRGLIQRMRAGIPGLALRTTFIVGFPGETEEDFAELLAFIEETRFERASVFNYSREEGTRAAKFEGQIHHMTRKRRWKEAMRALQRQAEAVNEAQVGRRLRVLVESPGQGRSEMDAPDVDATVYIPETYPLGEFVDVTITGWRGYDLIGKPV